MNSKTPKSIAVIVAHPVDETLWAGGTILNHPQHKWFIVCLSWASDLDCAHRFYSALKALKAEGVMGNMDDELDQLPLDDKVIETEILKLLPNNHFDIILTHNSASDNICHLQHEDVNRIVTALWLNGKISAKELWTFCFEDANKNYFAPIGRNANITENLSEAVWAKKYDIITEIYGFDSNSCEAKTTPTIEAFWKFKDLHHAYRMAHKFDSNIKMSKLSILKLLSPTK
jgi:LmbE family N-acetylglucosaminyl deacetylase